MYIGSNHDTQYSSQNYCNFLTKLFDVSEKEILFKNSFCNITTYVISRLHQRLEYKELTELKIYTAMKMLNFACIESATSENLTKICEILYPRNNIDLRNRKMKHLRVF